MQIVKDPNPIYQIDGFQLYFGNCLEVMQNIPENSIDMIFADPPYNLSNGGFTCRNGRRTSVDKGNWDQSQGLNEDFAFHQKWIAACYRILKPEGTIWISGSYHSIYACGYALQLTGFKILNDIAWFKPNATPNLSCRYFTASHETLIWARKSHNARHTFNYEDMKFGDWHLEDNLKKPDKQMRSVWSLSTTRGSEKRNGRHPTQKPISLLSRIVLASTNQSDVILDPFTGSSTTGLAAYRYGRQFIGIDNQSEYIDLSILRIEELCQTIQQKPSKAHQSNQLSSKTEMPEIELIESLPNNPSTKAEDAAEMSNVSDALQKV
jgi:site-specific DNA-methyltransferase (adenine-specific)